MNNPSSSNLTTILLVEDNPGDIRLLQEIFREGKVCNHLEIVRNGADAMAFLRKEEPYTEAPRPDLILLDLNLPKKNGNEVLSEIKQDEKLKRIPVIILTASQSEEDVSTAYDHYANCYLTKPIDLDQFIEVVHQIKSFWLSIVKIPEE